FEVKGPHRDDAGHGDSVRDGGGNPDCTMRGNNPGASAGSDGHDSTRRVDDLIAIMKVQRHDLCGWVVGGERGDVRSAISGTIEDRTLALLRHQLTQYRKYSEAVNRRLKATYFSVELR